MHTKLIDEIITKGNNEDMKYLEKVLIELITDLKHTDYSKYKAIEYNMYKQVNGSHICEELAKEWVSSMENKDGSIGGKWTIEETEKYNNNHDKYDWYVVMNMAYSDYCNKDFTINNYVDLANDILNDKDACPDKLLRYYMYIVK